MFWSRSALGLGLGFLFTGAVTAVGAEAFVDSFKPPQVFKNKNLLRTINLEKGYISETVNVVIENIDKSPQSELYVPFETAVFSLVGGFQVRDKKATDLPPFTTEALDIDSSSASQFYRITLPSPLQPSQQQTLSISFSILSTLSALPAKIEQQEKQYIQHRFSTIAPSAYHTDNQKTKLKFGTVDIPDYTGEPDRQGTTFTYGPYTNKAAGVSVPASVRYEFTRPIVHSSLLERDVEVSHWGGNLAIEERYWLVNQGAKLVKQFSRLEWAVSQQYPSSSSALYNFDIPMHSGSADAYFVDDIGNVSTSRFRRGTRDANLELTPRYPIFGGWKYSFKIGWNNNLKSFLRRLNSGNAYVLKVPFLQGPKLKEGITYGNVVLRFVLPEGASNVQFQTAIPHVVSDVSVHKTFMDTIGRTTLTLTVANVVDQMRGQEVFVTYEYSTAAALRKPFVIFAGFLSVFVVAWAIGKLDMSIKAKV